MRYGPGDGPLFMQEKGKSGAAQEMGTDARTGPRRSIAVVGIAGPRSERVNPKCWALGRHAGPAVCLRSPSYMNVLRRRLDWTMLLESKIALLLFNIIYLFILLNFEQIIETRII